MAEGDGAQQTVDAFLAEHWRLDRALGEWWSALAEHRLAFPAWPAPWGRGWSGDDLRRWAEGMRRAGAIGPPTGLGTLMGAPVLLGHGTEDQQRRFLPDLMAGRTGWCQLFSEPAAGSDLAGLRCQAQPDGDEYVVTGQKVWTSGADSSSHGMLVARTDWDAPKHAGLTWFVLPMRQQGVEVRPLRQMNGRSHFSEVFLDEARAPAADVVGGVGGGWAVTTATLAFERQGLGVAGLPGPRPPAGDPRQLDRPVGELLEAHRSRTATDEPAGAGTAAAALSLARSHRSPGGTNRQDLAALWAQESVEAATATRNPLLAKLAWTDRLRAASSLSPRLLGAAGMLAADETDPEVHRVADFVLSQPSASIAGGTDEIQRNIIGERALGLPREPAPDKTLPFREVRHG